MTRAQARQAALVALFSQLTLTQQRRKLRMMWRCVPASQRKSRALAVAREFGPAEAAFYRPPLSRRTNR